MKPSPRTGIPPDQHPWGGTSYFVCVGPWFLDHVWSWHSFGDAPLRAHSEDGPLWMLVSTLAWLDSFAGAPLRVILTSIFLGHWAFLAGMGLS